MSDIEHAHPFFSINSYDKDGNLEDNGIFLHYGKTRIWVAANINGFDKYIEQLQTISTEIKEN